MTRRFFLYFIGIAIGSILVWVISDKKGTEMNYLPNDRVIHKISTSHLSFDSTSATQMIQMDIDSTTFQSILVAGDIAFDESITDRSLPCRSYVVYSEHVRQGIKMSINLCQDTVATLTAIQSLPRE